MKSIVLFLLSSLIVFSGDSEKAWGWRNSDAFPSATPPLKWSQVSKAMSGLTSQIDTTQVGESISDGVIREWLVLGPIDAPGMDKAKPFEKPLLENPGALLPKPGDKLNDDAWTSFKPKGSFILAKDIFGKSMLNKGMFMFTNVHSKADVTIKVKVVTRYWSKANHVRVWINGENCNLWSGTVQLKKGWNQVLVEMVSTSDKEEPNFGIMFWGGSPDDTNISNNIIWKTRLPWTRNAKSRMHDWWSSVSQPIIIGDKIITTADPQSLVCMDKATGKILWVRSDNYASIATDAERTKKARTFKKIDPLAERIKAIDALSSTRALTDAELDEKNAAEKKLFKLMFTVNTKKYYRPHNAEAGISGPTPVTDGTFVYQWYTTGITVCYDLNGKRQWITHEVCAQAHHGYASSPCIVGDILVTYGSENARAKSCMLIGRDKKTGAIRWQKEINNMSPNSSPSAATLQGKPVILLSVGSVLDAATGEFLFESKMYLTNRVKPVVFGDRIALGMHLSNKWAGQPFEILDFTTGSLAKPQSKNVTFPYMDYPKELNDSISFVASPAYHDGLVYYLRNDSLLVVVDADKAEIVYTRDLRTTWWAAGHRGGDVSSLTLAGKHIYVFDAMGSCIVFKPGRSYEEVARNKIEELDISGKLASFMSSPMFEGDRLYIKSEDHLYCIGPVK